MKAFITVIAFLGFFATSALRAADSSKAARATVIFDHPEKFRDIKDSDMATEQGKAAILNQLRDFIVDKASYLIPEGYHLTMTFTDIDLAGEFEPWRGSQWDDVRIIKSIYPPAFKFTWTVTGPQGQIVKQGKEDFSDLDFQSRFTLDTTDHLRFEKATLSDWMRNNLGDIKKIAGQR